MYKSLKNLTLSASQLQDNLTVISFIHSFIHRASQMPVIVPDVGNLEMNTEDKISYHQGVHILMHERETEKKTYTLCIRNSDCYGEN